MGARAPRGVSCVNRILVSQHVRGTLGIEEWLLRFIGQPIRPPQAGELQPATGNIQWHRREVFRGPARFEAGYQSAGAIRHGTAM